MKINIELPPANSFNVASLCVDEEVIEASNKNTRAVSKGEIQMSGDGFNYSSKYDPLLKQSHFVVITFQIDNDNEEVMDETVKFLQAAKNNQSFPIAVTELPIHTDDKLEQRISIFRQLNCALIVIPKKSKLADSQSLFEPVNLLEDVLKYGGKIQVQNIYKSLSHSGISYFGTAVSTQIIDLDDLFYEATANLLLKNKNALKSANSILVMIKSSKLLDDEDEEIIQQFCIEKGSSAKIFFVQSFFYDGEDSQVGIVSTLD